jgi:L-fucose mutarotase
MLRGISPILTGDLLKVLSDMGHGDEIVIADGNYSATADATQRSPIWVPCADTITVVAAVLNHFPLDGSFGSARYITETQGDPSSTAAQAFAALVDADDTSSLIKAVPRREFHIQAKKAYAIVATVDPRHYACFILRKGALPEPLDWPDKSRGDSQKEPS